MTEPSTRTKSRRLIGMALLITAMMGTWVAVRATSLTTLHLGYAILLVQALALAAVTGVALLAVPAPTLARRATPKP